MGFDLLLGVISVPQHQYMGNGKGSVFGFVSDHGNNWYFSMATFYA